MPVRAVGSTTPRIVSQRVTNPNAASFSFGGTPPIASRATADMVGNTMTASTIAAGSMPGPESEVLNSGIHDRCSCNQFAVGRILGITTKIPPQSIHDAGYCRQQVNEILEQQFPPHRDTKSWVRKIAMAMPKNPPISSANSEL